MEINGRFPARFNVGEVYYKPEIVTTTGLSVTMPDFSINIIHTNKFAKAGRNCRLELLFDGCKLKNCAMQLTRAFSILAM